MPCPASEGEFKEGRQPALLEGKVTLTRTICDQRPVFTLGHRLSLPVHRDSRGSFEMAPPETMAKPSTGPTWAFEGSQPLGYVSSGIFVFK